MSSLLRPAADWGDEEFMSVSEQIKALLKEADLYQRQGLLNEAKERYKKATDIIKKNSSIPNSQELIDAIVKKVVELNQKVTKINQALFKPEVSERKQDLIKNLFGSVRADELYINLHPEGPIGEILEHGVADPKASLPFFGIKLPVVSHPLLL